MKECNVVVSTPLYLVLDDVGWMHGWDKRYAEQPSRTGIPRKHVLEDYIVLEELGKALNMKIAAPLCLGEWDRHNILRRIPNSSPQGENWDSSEYLDCSLAEKIRDYLNSSEYIDFTFHGLLHDCWADGKHVGGQEFFPPEGFVKGNQRALASEDYIRKHIEAFYEIYNDWGFKAEIRNFVSPSSCINSWRDDSFTRILKDYGFRFWTNHTIEEVTVSDGIIKAPKSVSLTKWEAYDVDPDYLPDIPREKLGIIGGHWVNILRFNPENNLSRIDKWKKYIKRHADLFGVFTAADLGAACCQLVYRDYSKITTENNICTIDFTEADRVIPGDLQTSIYISVEKGDFVAENADVSVYEVKENYTTYKIDKKASVVRLRFTN